ncbi:MAG: ABC transporter permease [Lachnospiraceae bacterium]|nr:ABC transporter permease [Lachnospiraceae bacterium]
MNKESILKKPAVQALLSSLACIVLGLFAGFIVLTFIDARGAASALFDIIRNFFRYPSAPVALKYFGNTIVKTAPLLMCSLSILFAYKVGLFNIGVAGQYAFGTGLALFAALHWQLPWIVCILLACVGASLLGAISGFLKSYCNVNEVISGIMLNWLSLYTTNMMLTVVKETTSPYTKNIVNVNHSALLPNIGLDKLFNNNQYVTVAIPLAIVLSILVWFVLEKTKFGYELKATGFNKHAAKYCGMKEKRNTILTLIIAGALAGLGAAMFYLTGYEQWQCTQSSVPGMGFNGIAAAFLGGLHPIGAIFSSLFIQHITEGGAYVDKTLYCSQISDLISSIIIYLCGFVLFMKLALNKWLAKRDEAGSSKDAAGTGKGGRS